MSNLHCVEYAKPDSLDKQQLKLQTRRGLKLWHLRIKKGRQLAYDQTQHSQILPGHSPSHLKSMASSPIIFGDCPAKQNWMTRESHIMQKLDKTWLFHFLP